MDGFLKTSNELALCQIVGHSYDLDVAGLWEKMEAIFQKISEDEEILPMTHIEIVRYIRAMEQAVITEHSIHNPSDQTLWFRVNGTVHRVEPGETI